MSESTTHDSCEYDEYFTVEVTAGAAVPVLYSIVRPREDERSRLCRNINRYIAGKAPCQCEKCRTTLAGRVK